METRVYAQIGDIPGPAWDALAGEGATPFLRHVWLASLEAAGCAVPLTGWHGCHLTVWSRGRLVAAAPAYLKDDSDGDFSRDWGWADAALRAGIPYYPKLVVAVPFTPVTGRRLLTAADVDRGRALEALLGAAEAAARARGARSLHVLFPSPEEARELEGAGWARRISFQYHWRNHGYTDPEAFLGCFDSKRRNQARRERAQPARQGITIRTVRGAEVTAFADTLFELHRTTVDKLMWGRRWLNRDFYRRVFEAMPDAIEVVLAERAGRVVAGAFNVATETHLYGRYWGCFDEHPFLHFNVCLYHSIDECIRRGVQVFEGGAGGEHKIQRGFEPAETYSAHRFLDERLELPLRQHIAQEAEERAIALARWRAASPILKRRPMVKERQAP